MLILKNNSVLEIKFHAIEKLKFLIADTHNLVI